MVTAPLRLSFSAASYAGRFRWWQPALVLGGVAAVFAVAVVPISLVLRSSVAIQQRGFDPAEFSAEAVGLSEPLFLFLTLLPFPLALATLLLLTRRVHGRRATTLSRAPGEGLRWGRALAGGALWLALALLGQSLMAYLHPDRYAFAFEPERFWPTALTLAALLPLQIAFEELLLRGYFHQVTCRVFGRPVAGVCLTAAVFGALHLSNPEVARFGLGAMTAFYVGFGLLLGAVAVLDDGLELALGVHLATNLAATLCVNYAGSALPTASVFRALDYEPGLVLATFAVQAGAFVLAFAKTSAWQLDDLFKPVPPPSLAEALPTVDNSVS